jgi:signal peptidase I
MERKTRPLRFLTLIPGLYPLLAFFVARRVTVKGWSMEPTLVHGERVFFDRLAFGVRDPERGDVVLARHPARPGIRMIKRVGAVPGDEVVLESPEDLRQAPPLPEGNEEQKGEPRTLGDDEYLLLGDNPYESTDSRELGSVRRRDILARAWLVYWPPDRWRRVE